MMEKKLIRLIVNTDTQKVLFAVLQNPNRTASELKDIAKVSTTSIYRTLEKLSDSGLISAKTMPRFVGKNAKVYRPKMYRANFLKLRLLANSGYFDLKVSYSHDHNTAKNLVK